MDQRNNIEEVMKKAITKKELIAALAEYDAKLFEELYEQLLVEKF